jgi:protoporphyrinogen oxidase
MRVVIVGGGIAGLFTAIMCKTRLPNAKITIVEKNSRLGGRVFTKKYIDGSSFESGAGRFGMKHKILMALLRRYNLDRDIIPISNKIVPKLGPLLKSEDYRNISPEQILYNLSKDPRLTKEDYMANTIETLVRRLYGNDAARKVIHQFEYDSEIQIARAQTSLHSILNTFRGDFGVLKGGLSRLIDEMIKELSGSKSGVIIMKDTECTSIERDDDGSYTLALKSGVGGLVRMLGMGNNVLQADKLIVCTPKAQAHSLLQGLIGREQSDLLYGSDVIQDEPLMRIYARFPKNWIDTKIVSRKAIRYIIPVSNDPPIVMISYTDGPIARLWSNFREKVGDRETIQELMKQLRGMFPRKSIPDPIWVSFEEHPVGASYWKPSTEDVTSKKMRKTRQNPLTNVYVCGEFLSMYHQAWMEGALETSLRVVQRYSPQ